MRDDHWARSPDRGRVRESKERRDYRPLYDDIRRDDDDEEEDDDYYRSRHGDYYSAPPTRSDKDDSYIGRDDRHWSRHPDNRPEYEPSGNYRDSRFDDHRGMTDDSPRRGDYRSGDRHGGYQERDRQPDPGEPSDTVMLEGIPVKYSVESIRGGITNALAALNVSALECRIHTSGGTRRAFVQFGSLDAARSFMDDQFPHVQITVQNVSDDSPDGRFTAYMHYARVQRHDGPAPSLKENWRCPDCNFSNFGTRVRCKECGRLEPPKTWKAGLDGSTDATISNESSQILVVYPLPSFVDEDSFATDVKKLERIVPKAQDPSEAPPKLMSTAPSSNPLGVGARPDSIHRIFLMRDVKTDESFKYGFVEFWSKEDAIDAMAKFKAATKFTVGDSPVQVCYIHMGVFVALRREVLPDEARLSFSPLFNPSVTVQYRDHHVYPSQKVITTAAPVAETAPKPAADVNPLASTKGKKRKLDHGKSDGAPYKKHPISSQMAKWQQKHYEIHGKTGTEDEGPKIKMSLSGIKLGGSDQPSARTASVDDELTCNKEAAAAAASEELVVGPITNREKIMCFLCMLKFKDLGALDAHEMSTRHVGNMKDAQKLKEAQEKYQRSIGAAKPPADPTTSTNPYRDRAKERREIHNQPEKPHLATKTKTKSKPPQPKADTPAKNAASKGAAIMQKLGYKAGSGLGAQGEGRIDALTANVYQEGVGLGAEGGNMGDASKEAERKTKGSYKEYVDTVNEKARERFQHL